MRWPETLQLRCLERGGGQVGGRAAAQVKGQSVIGALPGSRLVADHRCEALGLGQPLHSAAVC